MFRCSSCKRAFRKERHYTTHKCLASSDYVDITRRELVEGGESGGEEGEGEDADSTADFHVYNRSVAPPVAAVTTIHEHGPPTSRCYALFSYA